MIVIPDQPGALTVRIVVLSLPCLQLWVEPLVEVPLSTLDTWAVLAIRSKPGKRTPIADPGNESPMEMGCDRILMLLCIGEIGTGVDWQDVPGRQLVRKRDLDRLTTLYHKDATQVPLKLSLVIQRLSGMIAP